MNGVFNNIENPLNQEGEDLGKKVALGLGVIVYGIVLLLTAAHNYNLVVSGVVENARWLAVVGVVALELNAVALPIALHYWATSGAHRMAAITFYGLDIAILFANSLVDSKLVMGDISSLPAWGPAYLNNFAQVSPIISLVIWAILFMLDPANRAKEQFRKMVAYAQLTALNQTNEYLKSEDFARHIARRGDEIGRYVLSQAFNGQMFNEEAPDTEPPAKRGQIVAGNIRRVPENSVPKNGNESRNF